jgi:hypothetical protein
LCSGKNGARRQYARISPKVVIRECRTISSVSATAQAIRPTGFVKQGSLLPRVSADSLQVNHRAVETDFILGRTIPIEIRCAFITEPTTQPLQAALAYP